MFLRDLSRSSSQQSLPYSQGVILAEILKLVRQLMSKLDDLTAEVASIRSVEDSAIALINGLGQQLRDALAANAGAGTGGGISEADATQILLGLESGRAALAAAVTANTPSAPAPTEPAPAASTEPTAAPAADAPAAS